MPYGIPGFQMPQEPVSYVDRLNAALGQMPSAAEAYAPLQQLVEHPPAASQETVPEPTPVWKKFAAILAGSLGAGFLRNPAAVQPALSAIQGADQKRQAIIDRNRAAQIAQQNMQYQGRVGLAEKMGEAALEGPMKQAQILEPLAEQEIKPRAVPETDIELKQAPDGQWIGVPKTAGPTGVIGRIPQDQPNIVLKQNEKGEWIGIEPKPGPTGVVGTMPGTTTRLSAADRQRLSIAKAGLREMDRIEELVNKRLTSAPGGWLDTDQQLYDSSVQQAVSYRMYGLTGKTATVPEYKRLKTGFPLRFDTDEAARSKIDARRQEFQDTIDQLEPKMYGVSAGAKTFTRAEATAEAQKQGKDPEKYMQWLRSQGYEEVQ